MTAEKLIYTFYLTHPHTMVFKNSDNPYLGLSEFFMRIFQEQTAIVSLS